MEGGVDPTAMIGDDNGLNFFDWSDANSAIERLCRYLAAGDGYVRTSWLYSDSSAMDTIIRGRTNRTKFIVENLERVLGEADANTSGEPTRVCVQASFSGLAVSTDAGYISSGRYSEEGYVPGLVGERLVVGRI